MPGLRSLVVAALLALGLALHPTLAAACTLTELPGVYERDFAKADLVFTGTVLSVESAASAREPVSASMLRWTFAVDGVEKGFVNPKQEVRSSESGSACGYPFEVGQRYRVFATVQDGHTAHAGTDTGVQHLSPLPPSILVPGIPILVIAMLAAAALVSMRAFRRRSSTPRAS
ncbi:MAG TPA: hypothetical protein VFQ81_02915 [Candidatus Limnocylindria bacterium]|nr:hypothetical protein [Candidatus Limnocylindria bacterium]